MGRLRSFNRLNPFNRGQRRRSFRNMRRNRGMMMSLLAMAAGGTALGFARKRGVSVLQPIMNRVFK